jgi:very-short-patch-repair endonuclease
LKAIINIYDYKPVIDALTSVRNDTERAYICKLIDSYDKWSSSCKHSLQVLLDIIKHNEGKDANALYVKYKNSTSQYEKIEIRHGHSASSELKKKYNSRPKPSSITCLTDVFWINKGYTLEDAKLKIKEIQSGNSKKKHAKSTPVSYKNIPHCVEFWINRGYSLEEALSLKNEYNAKHARSYENMIRKYGEELGKKNILDAANKRKATLIDRYEVTTFGGVTSKACTAFMLPLYKRLRKIGIPRADICWGINGSREFATRYNGKNYFYDFAVKSLKIAIEYNGIYWHAREDLEWRRKDISKEHALEYDRTKREAIEYRGFILFTVWEDYDIIIQTETIFKQIKTLWENH